MNYRNGAEGFIQWCEDKVCIPIYPEGKDIPVWTPMNKLPSKKNPQTNRSYKDLWNAQKEIVRAALWMDNQRFKYRLIVLCWPRGEGKSFIACLIQLWKFCCWPKQLIVLGANSKDQIKFVHFDIIKDIVLNSPKLLQVIGKKNIQEKKIYMRSKAGNITSTLQPISSFSGIVSNITGYTFSEMFDMKNPKFFTQLDGSTRNIPNALGVIDSTVSSKQHVLYQLYTSYMDEKDPTLFFSYRCTKDVLQSYYWNPNMTTQQLRSYKAKFPLGDFERYFLNLWSAGSARVFTQEMIEATNYVGADKSILTHDTVVELLMDRIRIFEQQKKLGEKLGDNVYEQATELATIKRRLWPLETIYSLRNNMGQPQMATVKDLEKLGEIFDTDWAILGGVDRADPMKQRTGARTIMVFLAKGLYKSKSKPHFDLEAVPEYLYFLLHLANVRDHSLETMKQLITEVDAEFAGIDMICGERWGIWDLASWCDEREIAFEAIHPTYDRQKAAFSELYILYNTGRFKTPVLAVAGSREQDLLKEEAAVFDHEVREGTARGWFGSPEKSEKFGAQDDAMYATGWCVYGGRELGVVDFRPRRSQMDFGTFHPASGTLGLW